MYKKTSLNTEKYYMKFFKINRSNIRVIFKEVITPVYLTEVHTTINCKIILPGYYQKYYYKL